MPAYMDPDTRKAAEQYAAKACATFTPSRHFNAGTRTDGATMQCIVCHQPQYRHWLRQALERRQHIRPVETGAPST